MTAQNKHTGDRASNKGAEFAMQLERFPPWGEVVEVTMNGDASAALAVHGLRRAFQAAIIIGDSDGVPKVAYDADVVELLGLDPREYIVVDPSASSSGTTRVWVF